MKIKPRKAWAIVDETIGIHLDKVMRAKAEAWGLIADERSFGNRAPPTNAELKKIGYRCVRVEIRPVK